MSFISVSTNFARFISRVILHRAKNYKIPRKKTVNLFRLVVLRPMHAVSLLKFQPPNTSLVYLRPFVFLQSVSLLVLIGTTKKVPVFMDDPLLIVY